MLTGFGGMMTEQKLSRGGPVVSLGGECDEANFDTRDSLLAGALMAMGIEPVGSEPCRVITREHLSGATYQFYFKPVSDCGKWRTRELLKYWTAGAEWVEKNPDHPFAYAMAAVKNYRGLLDFINKKVPYGWVSRGKSIAMLPLDASLETQELLLGRMGK
jgi:hypothetical protein